MLRAGPALLFCLLLVLPAAAQTQAEGELRLRILELEEQIRRLTGQNERLTYEVNQLRTQLGLPLYQEEPVQTGAVTGETLGAPPAGEAAADAQQLGTLSVSPSDPLVAPDGAVPEPPVDLSQLATGVAPELVRPEFGNPNPPTQQDATQLAGLPQTPPETTSLTGSARDEFDLAYGYMLTGDYALAEQSFTTWLAAFPGDPQENDARFWLGESQLQQGDYQEAAKTFLAVYKTAPESNKGPDALLKLGQSLAALGEHDAACATFAEVGRKYPSASQSLMSRVRDEAGRAGC